MLVLFSMAMFIIFDDIPKMQTKSESHPCITLYKLETFHAKLSEWFSNISLSNENWEKF